MSVTNRRGEKVRLSRDGADPIVAQLIAGYAVDRCRLRGLVMVLLYEQGGLTLEQIGTALDHPKGHVSRRIRKVKEDVAAGFEISEIVPPICPTDPEAEAA